MTAALFWSIFYWLTVTLAWAVSAGTLLTAVALTINDRHAGARNVLGWSLAYAVAALLASLVAEFNGPVKPWQH